MQKVDVVFRNMDAVRSFVSVIDRLEGDFDLGKGSRVVDARSIIGVFSCDLSGPVELSIHSDDHSVLEALEPYIVK
ncbi:MAG: HPr family phosphocarrier protein [Eubacteriales bacterium]|nr:HPr family phosphocarrier protein [Eubacteriales bacterium]